MTETRILPIHATVAGFLSAFSSSLWLHDLKDSFVLVHCFSIVTDLYFTAPARWLWQQKLKEGLKSMSLEQVAVIIQLFITYFWRRFTYKWKLLSFYTTLTSAFALLQYTKLFFSFDIIREFKWCYCHIVFHHHFNKQHSCCALEAKSKPFFCIVNLMVVTLITYVVFWTETGAHCNVLYRLCWCSFASGSWTRGCGWKTTEVKVLYVSIKKLYGKQMYRIAWHLAVKVSTKNT